MQEKASHVVGLFRLFVCQSYVKFTFQSFQPTVISIIEAKRQ